jgi:hypothetical protein
MGRTPLLPWPFKKEKSLLIPWNEIEVKKDFLSYFPVLGYKMIVGNPIIASRRCPIVVCNAITSKIGDNKVQ